MTSLYPIQIDSSLTLPTIADNFTAVNGAAVNRLRDAILNIESELGVKPSGVNGTLRSRLDQIDTVITNLANSVITVVGTPNVDDLLGWNGTSWSPTNQIIANQITATQINATSLTAPTIESGIALFDGMSEPALSAAGQGSIYYDSTANAFKASSNGGAYLPLFSGLERTVGPADSGAEYICDGTADDVQINAAITEANSSGAKTIVRLFPGTYYVSNPIVLKSNVILAGSGMGATKIVVATGYSSTHYFVIGTLGTEATGISIPLTSDAAQGTNVLQLSAESEFNNIATDDYLMLQSEALWETTNLSGRKVGEFVKVLSKSLSSIQIHGMTRDNYTTSDTATLYRMSFTQNCGIRDLEIYQQDTLDTRIGNIPPLVSFQKAKNAVIENCKMHRNDGPGITVFQSVDVTVSDCIIADLTDNTPQNRLGYGCLIGGASENVVVKGCKISRVRHGVDCGPSRAPSSPTNNYGIPRGVSVVSNVCSHATNAAYSTHSEGENFSFVGNVASNCDSYGIFMRARGCRIASNTIEWCGGGIGIGNSNFDSSGGSASGSHVVGNTIRHIKRLSNLGGSVYALGEGIILALTDNVIVTGNTISDCDAAGIRLRVGTVRCVISKNTILNCNLRNASGNSSEAIIIDGNFNGSVASLASKAGNNITLTGATNIAATHETRTVTISGAATPANNGTFPIVSALSSTSFTYTNASGVAPDANNGAITYAIEGSTDNILEHNFASNTTASRYDGDVVGHMKYLIRDYGGAGGNVRNVFKDNTGIAMETGLLSVNSNSYQAGNSSTESTVIKTGTTAPVDSNFLTAPQAGTLAANTTDNKVYIRTTTVNTWRSLFPIGDLLENIQFNSTVSSPTINQGSTSSGNGTNLLINAQNSTGFNGGNLVLSAGSGISNGTIRIAVAGNTGIQLSPSNNGQSNYNVISGATSVLFNHSSTSAANGASWTIQAQNSALLSSTGGALLLTSGTGTSLNGPTRIQVGGTTLIEAAQVVAGQNVVALAKKGSLNNMNMGANTGDGVVYLANAATAPTANPISGAIIWSESGVVKIRQTDGNVITLQTAVQDSVGHRLTLTTAVPITSSDVTGASTIYLTPHTSDRIDLYNGTSWQTLRTNEISLALSGLTTDRNYDVFAYNNSGTVTLELSAAWNSDNITRTDALTRQNGILVKSSATTRRYIGTIRTTGTTTTEDSVSKRFVWNYYNKVERYLLVSDSTDTWTYALTTIRQARATAANKVEIVLGQPSPVHAEVHGIWQGTGGSGIGGIVGIGLDTTTAYSSKNVVRMADASEAGAAAYNISHGYYNNMVAEGYHALNWNESSSGAFTITFAGDLGFSAAQSVNSHLSATVSG